MLDFNEAYNPPCAFNPYTTCPLPLRKTGRRCAFSLVRRRILIRPRTPRRRSLRLYLVHHGDAVGPDVDPRRPLSDRGRRAVELAAADAASRGCRPQSSGTAESCARGRRRRRSGGRATRSRNSPRRATCSQTIRRRGFEIDYEGKCGTYLLAGHFPHLPRLLMLLRGDEPARTQLPSTRCCRPRQRRRGRHVERVVAHRGD